MAVGPVGPKRLRYPRRVGIRERIAFWRQFRRNFATTGAVQPSSRYLARAMVAPVRDDPRPEGVPRRLVELGPGTGAVTRAIAATMRPGDRLDCYELNERFARFLRERIDRDDAFAEARDRIRVHAKAAEQAQSREAIDFVICSIPLNNLTPEKARHILAVGFDLLAGRGWFTYFEYPLLPTVRRMLASAEGRRRIDGIGKLKDEFAMPGTRSDFVLRNVPPARAVHVPVHASPYGEVELGD